MHQNHLRKLIAVLLMGMLCGAAQAASIGLSPSSITDAYRGWLEVTVSGVPAGADAVIEVALDFDHDGVMDPGEVVFLHHPVKDGQAPPVAGCGIAGDEDGSANGTINTRLDLWGSGHPTGQLLVRARGSWGSETAALTVSPRSTAQSVSGTLRNAAGQPIQGIVWSEDYDESEDWITGTEADGTYTLYISQPGGVVIGGYLPGMIMRDEEGIAPLVTLSVGEHRTGVDLTLYEGTTTVAGRVYDASTGEGLEGLWVDLYDTWECEASTGADGTFVLEAFPGEVTMGIYDLAERGYVGISDEIELEVPEEGLSGLEFPMQKADSYITGRVYRSDNGQGLPGVELDIGRYLEEGEIDIDVYTVEDGRYAVGVLAGPEYWHLAVEEGDIIPRGLISAPARDERVTTPGTILENVDFALGVAGATIEVWVMGMDERPIADVWVYVWADGRSIGRETNIEGQCTLGVRAGTYRVHVSEWDLNDEGYLGVAPQEVSLATGEVREVYFMAEQMDTPTPTPTGTPLVTPTSTPVGTPSLVGDTNEDGLVNSIDFLYFSRFWIESVTGTSPSCNVVPDAVIDQKDLLMLIPEWR